VSKRQGNYAKCMHPRYALYIRRSDRVMRLLETTFQQVEPIRAIVPMPNDLDRGILVHLADTSKIGVYLMSHEIHVVEELPEVEGNDDVVADMAQKTA
jgi:hypothetical protein